MNTIRCHILALAAVGLSFFAGHASAQTFKSPESILALIPADVHLKQAGRWSVVSFAAANEAMTSQSAQKEGTFKFKVNSFEPNTQIGNAFLIRSTAHTMVKGQALPCEIYAYFDADQANMLKNVRVGDQIAVTANIKKTELQARGIETVFILDLMHCKAWPNR